MLLRAFVVFADILKIIYLFLFYSLKKNIKKIVYENKKLFLCPINIKINFIMKKITAITLLITMALGLSTWAQKTRNTSQSSFERFLLDAGYDKNGNKLLEEEELVDIISLNCSNKGLSDLKGIEKLTNLEILNASNNNLSVVTLTNKILIEVNLSNNKLTQLNIAECENLTGGYAKFNAQQNPNLKCIKVSSRNQLGATKAFRQNWLKDDTAQFSVNCN